MMKIKTETYAKILANDLSFFTRKVFKTINPNTPYIHNWHIDYLASIIADPENRRLIVNVPPRSMKSTLITIAFPAWLLARNPSQTIICASYADNLARKHSIECRQVVQSDWYRACFPHIQLSDVSNTTKVFTTTRQGSRTATSTGGTLTGLGADIIICDDILNGIDAQSQTYREGANTWFEQQLQTRLNDKVNGRIIVIGQRLHTDDITGFLLNKEGWRLIKLPAEFNEDATFEWINPLSGGLEKKVVKAGDTLNAREPKDILEQLQKDLGSYAYASQYLQEPVPIGGGIIKKDFLRYYGQQPIFNEIYQSWDTAVKTSETNDYSVCLTWGVLGNEYYLLDCFRNRVVFTDLVAKARQLAEKFNPKKIIIEDKSSGQQLIQDLRRNSNLPIVPVQVDKDKGSRLAQCSFIFEAGRVHLPSNAFWVKDYVAELTSFPLAKHDDLVDATTLFLNYVAKPKNVPNIRIL
jgi:predicted phage terminase large subunit-like protein